LQIFWICEKLRRYKSPGIDHIPAELIQAGGSTLYSEIYKLIHSIWNKELPQQWNLSLYPFIKGVIKLTVIIIEEWISMLPTTYKILFSIFLSRFTPHTDAIIGDHQCGFQCNRSATDQIFCTCQILEKNGTIMG